MFSVYFVEVNIKWKQHWHKIKSFKAGKCAALRVQFIKWQLAYEVAESNMKWSRKSYFSGLLPNRLNDATLTWLIFEACWKGKVPFRKDEADEFCRNKSASQSTVTEILLKWSWLDAISSQNSDFYLRDDLIALNWSVNEREHYRITQDVRKQIGDFIKPRDQRRWKHLKQLTRKSRKDASQQDVAAKVVSYFGGDIMFGKCL